MILPIKNSADNLSPSLYLSWPAFDTHNSHGRKHFFSSFELKVSFQVVFLTIVNRIFAGHLKFQNLEFFLQFLVSHIPLVSGWLCWQTPSQNEVTYLQYIGFPHYIFFSLITYSFQLCRSQKAFPMSTLLLANVDGPVLTFTS